MKIKIPNPIQDIKEKHYDIGYKDGYNTGRNEGFDIGFSKGETQGYEKAINELNSYIEKENKKQKNIFNDLDGTMMWLTSISEIKDTNFFKNIYFSNVNSSIVKSYLDFILTIEKECDIKPLYPLVHYYLPEYKQIFAQIYQNKLAVEEAERFK